jgi:hypothetical protein
MIIKKQLSYLIILLALTCVALGKYNGGTGEPNDPYHNTDVNVTANNSSGSAVTNSSRYYSINAPYTTNLDTILIISGYVLKDGAGVEGAVVSDGAGTTSNITNASGYYEIILYLGWSGSLSVYKEGMAFSPESYSYSDLSESLNEQNFNFVANTQFIATSVSATNDDGFDSHYSLYLGGQWYYIDNHNHTGDNLSVFYDLVFSDRRGWAITGVRFDVNVPPQAVVTNAVLSFKIRDDSDGWPFHGRISGESNVNPEDFEQYVQGRDLTTNSVPWSITTQEPNTWVQSPNLSSVINEIINLPGWSQGNPMVLIYHGYVSGSFGKCSFFSYDHLLEDAPHLEITYECPLKISGYVKNEDANGVAGVVLSANNNGGSGVTNASGYYELMVPAQWTGEVTPSLTGYGFNPQKRTYTNLIFDVNEQNYVTRMPIVSGYVKRAIDNLPVPDVNVLLSGIGAMMTNVDGFFSFEVPGGWSGTLSLSKAGIVGEVYNITNVTSDMNSTYIVKLTYNGGTGEPNNPYQIANVVNLLTLACDANDYNKCFILTTDIDLDPNLTGNQIFTTAVIAPDEDNSNWEFDGVAFTGVFDGAGHTIRNVIIDTNGDAGSFLGLFGFIGDSEIKNLRMENIHIDSGNRSLDIGGMVGNNTSGEIRRSSCSGSIIASDLSYRIGGLVGNNQGDIIECFSKTSVTAGDSSKELGALIGRNQGLAINVYASATVTCGNSCRYIGGLIGLDIANSDSLKQCYASCFVQTGSSPIAVGGLIGDKAEYPLDPNAGFWDISLGAPNNGLGIALNTEQMQTAITFMNAGWDFVGETANGYEDIWRMCQDGVDYPHLVWEFYIYGDLTCPDGVDFIDYSVLANQWMLEKLEQDYNSDGRVNFKDWATFANNWGVSVSYTELSSFLAHWLARSATIADIAPLGGDDFVDWQDLMLLCEHWLSQ